MNFYDTISPFAGHHIIVDNAKRYPTMTTSNTSPIESNIMPPLEKCCYRADGRRRKQSKKQKQQTQHQQKPHNIFSSSTSCRNDSIMITKESNSFVNTQGTLTSSHNDKIMITKQKETQYQKKSHMSLSLSPPSSHKDSIMMTKESNKFENTPGTVLIPQKFFYDDAVTSKQKKNDKAPKAPIRPQSYYITTIS